MGRLRLTCLYHIHEPPYRDMPTFEPTLGLQVLSRRRVESPAPHRSTMTLPSPRLAPRPAPSHATAAVSHHRPSPRCCIFRPRRAAKSPRYLRKPPSGSFFILRKLPLCPQVTPSVEAKLRCRHESPVSAEPPPPYTIVESPSLPRLHGFRPPLLQRLSPALQALTSPTGLQLDSSGRATEAMTRRRSTPQAPS